MNSKKITLAEWTEIGQYNHARKWIRPFCSYTLIKESDTRFKREQRVGILAYLLMFIPVHLLQVLWCVWDGGLKEFKINERYLGGDLFTRGNIAFDRAERLWNNKY